MASGTSRAPRAWLSVGGMAVPLLAWEAQVNRLQQADTFHASTAVNVASIGAWSALEYEPAQLWASNEGFGGGRVLVDGYLDAVDVEINPARYTVTFQGRGKESKLIDAVNTQKDVDKPASDIVRDIAGKHGLSADVDPTGNQAGKQHTEQHTHLTHNQTDWNTIAELAQREGMIFFMAGGTVYFKEPGADYGLAAYPVWFSPPGPGGHADGNFTQIRLRRNTHLAQGVESTARSAHTWKKESYVSKEGGGKLKFVKELPGLLQDQVQRIARKEFETKTRHEMNVDVTMPGDVNIDPRMMLNLSGFGGWDQGYFIDTIVHSGTVDQGYQMAIRGKNKRGG